MKADDPYPNPPVIMLRGAAYSKPVPPMPTPPPTQPMRWENGEPKQKSGAIVNLTCGCLMFLSAAVVILVLWLQAVAK